MKMKDNVIAIYEIQLDVRTGVILKESTFAIIDLLRFGHIDKITACESLLWALGNELQG